MADRPAGPPRALVVQHIAVERPYTIRAALESRGVDVTVWLAGTDEPLPELAGFHGLVLMGGPQSAYDDDRFPTRAAELDAIRSAHDAGMPALGVCLGAQLIAVALGGEGHRGEAGFECGWAPVVRNDVADELFDAAGPVSGPGGAFPALHWHGDTFTLPPGAVLLASSDRYPHQAFRVGATTWGVQFHIEVDADAVEHFCTEFARTAGRHAPGGVEGIRAATPGALAAVEPVRDAAFGGFADRVVGYSAGGHRAG